MSERRTCDVQAGRIAAAFNLLVECLNAPEPWEAEKLVARLEDVFLALGGKIENGRAVAP